MNLLRLITFRQQPEDTGPVLFTPAAITTALWLDASDSSTITLNGSNVSQWDDKSGNARHFSQPTSNNQPTYGTNIQNGLNAVQFNNSTKRVYLENTTFQYSGNTMHMFSVHINNKGGGATIYGRLFSFAASGQQDYNNTNGILLTYGTSSGISLYRNSATVCSTSAINNTWALVDAQRNGTSGKISLNGNSYSTGSTSSANQNIQRSRIGNDFNAIDSGMNGYIAENILLTYIPTSDVETKLQGYLAHKWGLTANLPAGHPYKTTPPYV